MNKEKIYCSEHTATREESPDQDSCSLECQCFSAKHYDEVVASVHRMFPVVDKNVAIRTYLTPDSGYIIVQVSSTISKVFVNTKELIRSEMERISTRHDDAAQRLLKDLGSAITLIQDIGADALQVFSGIMSAINPGSKSGAKTEVKALRKS